MTDLQALKFQNVVPPAAIYDNAAWTILSPGYQDTFGMNYVAYIVSYGATDIATVALKLTECETSGGSYTDVPLADFSVLPLTLPSATDDNHLFAIFCPVNGLRKRYQKIVGSFGDGSAGTFASCLAIFSPTQKPYDATTRGLTQQAIVAG